MTATELKEGLKNGLGNRILASFLGGLLLAATVGAWQATAKLSAILEAQQQILSRMDRMDDRITYLERRQRRTDAGQ